MSDKASELGRALQKLKKSKRGGFSDKEFARKAALKSWEMRRAKKAQDETSN